MKQINIELLALYMASVQVKSFKNFAIKTLDKRIAALLIVSFTALILKITAEELAQVILGIQ